MHEGHPRRSTYCVSSLSNRRPGARVSLSLFESDPVSRSSSSSQPESSESLPAQSTLAGLSGGGGGGERSGGGE